MRSFVFKDWKYGEVKAIRMVEGVFVHSRDLMKVLGIKSTSGVRMKLKKGGEVMVPCLNSLGRYSEGVFINETRAYELLGKNSTPLYSWVKSWLKKSIDEAINNNDRDGVIEVRTKKQGSVRENLRKAQLLCLSEYLVYRGYGKGTPLSGAKLLFANELEAGCNEWRDGSGERVTAISVVRDMKLLGYLMRKGDNGCAFWINVKGSRE